MHIGLFVKDFAIGKKFSKNGLPTKSGAEFHAENHALQLIKRGHQVTIFAKKRMWSTKARENINGIDLVRLHEPFRGLEILFRLFTTHRDIDAFYILGTAKFAVWAILYAHFVNERVVMAITGKSEIFNKKTNWRNKLFSTCDHYIALSREIKQGFIEQGGIEDDKVTVLGQGIDTNRFPMLTDREKKVLRKYYKIDEEALVLVFCARLVPDKGIHIFAKIWPDIHKKYPQAVFLVVGGGRKDMVELLQRVSNETQGTLKVIGEVESPTPYYQIADVNVFPSKHEGLPTSLMEAMSCGVPAVVSQIGGCEDLITDGQTGYLVDKEDSDAFLKKVLYLFEHEDKRKCMGKNAAIFAKEHCDYSEIIWRLEDILAGKYEVV